MITCTPYKNPRGRLSPACGWITSFQSLTGVFLHLSPIYYKVLVAFFDRVNEGLVSQCPRHQPGITGKGFSSCQGWQKK